MAIRDDFFTSLANGAKWDVGVSINRTNPLPLDQYSVFKTEEELNTYVSGAFSYPGQILALVGESETIIYYLDQNKEKQEVGSMPAVDNKSIKIKVDETTGEEILTLVGLETAATGSSLIKLADGSIGWSSTTQEGLTADLTGIKSDISELNTTVYGVADGTVANNGLTSKVAALEKKFTDLGGIFSFRGSITVGDNETIADKITFTPVAGDVVLVNGKQEYVYVDNKWEPFGDPHGVEELANTVAGHTGDITGLQSRMSTAEGKIGAEASEGKDATGLYLYADTVAKNKADAAQAAAEATAAAALSPVSQKADKNESDITALNTAVSTKAEKTYVDNQISAVNTEVAKKADATETTNALNQKATKDELTNGLAEKADKTATETAISSLDTRLTTAEGDIDKLEAAIGQAGEDGKYPTTSLTGRVVTLEATDITHGQDINSLKAGLGTFGDNKETIEGVEVYKSTAFAQAAKAYDQAITAGTAAAAADAKAVAAGTAASTADGKAVAAQGKADEAYNLAATKVDQSAYDARVKSVDDSITALNTAVSTKAEKTYVDGELAKKVDQTAYDTKVGELNGAIALKASTEYVDTELAKKADKTATETAISEINAKIGTLGNVMNFVGKLTTDENGNITLAGKTPEDGDVGFIDTFEYVYINGEWVKFGDTSAESGRISALETTVGDSDSGLVKAVADLQAEDIAIKATATTLSTSVDTRFTAVNETLTSLGSNKVDVSVYNEKIAALEAADTKEAEDRSAAIEAEQSARATAITNLTTYIDSALAWGSF